MSCKLHVLVATVLLASFAAAQEGSECKIEGDLIASAKDCKQYLECVKGKFVSKECGWWHKFDIVKHECRWSPLATCRKSNEQKQDEHKQHAVKAVVNFASGVTADCYHPEMDDGQCMKNTAVLNQCTQYCICDATGALGAPVPCPGGKFYDAATNECRDDFAICKNTPSNIKPGSKCKSGQKSMNLTNCKSYVECEKDVWVSKSCGFGYYYKPAHNSCEINWFSRYC